MAKACIQEAVETSEPCPPETDSSCHPPVIGSPRVSKATATRISPVTTRLWPAATVGLQSEQTGTTREPPGHEQAKGGNR